MHSSLSWRTALSVFVACATLLTSAPALQAQETGTDQPDVPSDVQQLVDQAQNGQAPANVQQLIDQVQHGQIPADLATSPLPQQATLSQLRELLDALLKIERQRELLGDPTLGDQPDPSIPALQLELLTRDYNENVLPTLQNAATDCLAAQLGLSHALSWAQQVQALGLSNTPEDTQDVGAESPAVGGYGPLAGEMQNVQSLYVQILQNCDKQVYDSCVRDDGDPNGDYLGVFLQQLAYFDDDPIYQQRYVNCSYGWHGTLTIHEQLTGGTQPRVTSSGNGNSTTEQWNASGTRDLNIELANKKDGATATARGHSTSTTQVTSTDPRCRTTHTQTVERTVDASGGASLRKISNTGGGLTLGYRGPVESGGTEHSSTTVQSNCGGPQRPDATDAVLPSAGASGEFNDKLDSPQTESISGSRSATYVLDGSRPSLQSSVNNGSVVQVGPGVGAILPAPGDNYMPWLNATPPAGTDRSQFPVVRVTISWNLTFGQPTGG
jgi:hypothetical protein